MRAARGLIAVLALALALTLTPGIAEAAGPGDEVDVFVGTGGRPPWLSGGTTPAASLPFGMVQVGPDSTADPHGGPSATAAGYAATDPLLRGFSATHLSGAGCPAFGDARILPLSGALPADLGAATVGLRKPTELAAPGRYSVALGNGIWVTVAAATRSGLLRLRYPARSPARLIVKSTSTRFLSARELMVRARGGGFCGADNAYTVHVLMRFDQPIRAHGNRRGGTWIDFGTRPTVNVQVAISYVDAAGARANLAADAPGWSVGMLAARAASVWKTELARVAPTGGTKVARRLLRTALYHVLLHPTPINDVDGRYPGTDGRIHRLTATEVRKGVPHLSSISGWDVYRTQVPLLAWLRPDIASAIVCSLLRDARDGGHLPRWPIVGDDARVMNGDPAGPIAAAAYAFGARDFPLRELVNRLVRQAHDVGGLREGLGYYLRLGWVPTPGMRSGAATTLEYAVADFAISRLAVAAGRPGVAARFRTRSGQWRHLLDKRAGLLQPRNAAGAFGAAGQTGFLEGSAEQYTFGGVPQDMAGLLHSLGPGVNRRLDTFFSQLNALGEPYAWLGNEPSLLSPWTYQWLGDPASTQDVVDRARRELWSLAPAGLPGNDDLGALSAWYVWTSLGLYPLTPGTPNLAVGVPAFSRILVRPRGGAASRIVRVGAGPHVGALRVDGRPRTASWLGGRPKDLAVTTTAVARPAWGRAPADRPPSYPTPASRPR